MAPASQIKPEESYDLVVVGAGIYGAWSAFHAKQRGLKVLLVDENDFGSQTSSSSTKLIHGGLRYLENFEFSLVRKSLEERSKLHQLFPHLFKATNFLIPVTPHSPAPMWKIRFGLWLYDHLSWGKQPVEKSHRILPLAQQKYRGIFKTIQQLKMLCYGDGVTDDHRLTLHVVMSYLQLGGEIRTYCHAQDITNESHPHHNLSIKLNTCDTKSDIIKTDKILYCVGSSHKNFDSFKSSLVITKGVHITLPKIQIEEAILLNSPIDGRFFFVVPWYGRTMVGTTDTISNATYPAEASSEDIEYLLKSLNHHIKGDFNADMICGSFAGYRVLVDPREGTASQQSRGWKLSNINNKSYFSLGGKLTSARIDALEIMTTIYPNHCATHSGSLWGVNSESDFLQTNYLDIGLNSETIQHLYFRYGHRANHIIDIIKNNSSLAKPIFSVLPFIWAEIHYTIQFEHVEHLVDIIRRRCPLSILAAYNEGVLCQIANIMSLIKAWSQERYHAELNESRKHWMQNLSKSSSAN